MPNTNRGVLDGVRRIGAAFRSVSVNGGIPGAPLGLQIAGATTAGPPTTGTWKAGAHTEDRNGAVWICIKGGTPGTWTNAAAPSSGVPPVTSGFTCFGTGGFNQCLNSSSGFNLSPVAGTWYYAALYIPFNVSLTGAVITPGSTGGTDEWIVALWPIAGGAALANSSASGTAAPNANTRTRIPFTSPVAVTGPGVYILGAQSNGTHAAFLVFGNAAEGFIAGSVAGSFGTVPSLSPASTYTQNAGPYMSTY